jgi:hypothetical protein
MISLCGNFYGLLHSIPANHSIRLQSLSFMQQVLGVLYAYLFVCSLFRHFLSNFDYVASNERMIAE